MDTNKNYYGHYLTTPLPMMRFTNCPERKGKLESKHGRHGHGRHGQTWKTWAVDVVQLIKWSLPRAEIRSFNQL